MGLARLLARRGKLLDNPRAAGIAHGLLVGLLDDLNLHLCVQVLKNTGVRRFVTDFGGASTLLARRGKLLDNPRATGIAHRLLVGLLDDLDFHGLVLVLVTRLNVVGTVRLSKVLDRDVNEPGTQRPLLLVSFLAFVLHGVSLLVNGVA